VLRGYLIRAANQTVAAAGLGGNESIRQLKLPNGMGKSVV